MEDKLKAFLQDIQSKVSEAISMCDGEEQSESEPQETEEHASGDEPMDEGMPLEKSLRKEKLKLRLKKEMGA